MKLIVITSLSLFGMINITYANDYTSRELKTHNSVMETHSWSGLYFGLDMGAGWLEVEGRMGGQVGFQKLNGEKLGLFLGYQHQFENNIVLGVESDFQFNFNELPVQNGPALGEIDTDQAGSARLRVGYAFEDTLIYTTGGWTKTRFRYQSLNQTPKIESTLDFEGWTIGAGVEHALTQWVSARIEYRYNNFGSTKITGGELLLDQHTATVGLAVKF